MASRYTQEYIFHIIFMNVLFRNLSKIVHPNAENTPEYIRYYTSATFVNGFFWNDREIYCWNYFLKDI